MKQIVKTAWAMALAGLLLIGCGKGELPVSKTDFLLDTVVTVTLYDSQNQAILDEVFSLCKRYEKVFSRTDPASELYRLNRAQGKPVRVSMDLLTVLKRSLHYSQLTEGRYDVTVCPVMDLWDFTGENPSLPDPEELEMALARVGWENIQIQEDTVTLEGGAQVDLGSIAKGYIADRMADFLWERGVRSAILDLGGNIVAVGSKPDGKPFTVGIQDPFQHRDATVGTIPVANCSVVSSGIYERSFELDGALYHHILDPATGYPADMGVAGVTIVAPKSMDADALSTALFLMGRRRGLEMAQSLGVEAAFIETDGHQYTTPNFGQEQGRAESRRAVGLALGTR